MAEYIDREKVLHSLRVHSGNESAITASIVCIPVEDVAPVKHGKWVEVEDALVHGYCSVCNWEAILYETDVIYMNYCPNCGADMREAEREDDSN